jgi:hypothetical protein
MNEIVAMVGGIVMIGYFFVILIKAHLDGIDIPNTSEFI